MANKDEKATFRKPEKFFRLYLTTFLLVSLVRIIVFFLLMITPAGSPVVEVYYRLTPEADFIWFTVWNFAKSNFNRPIADYTFVWFGISIVGCTNLIIALPLSLIFIRKGKH